MKVNDKRYGIIEVTEKTAKMLKEKGLLVKKELKKELKNTKELKQRKTK